VHHAAVGERERSNVEIGHLPTSMRLRVLSTLTDWTYIDQRDHVRLSIKRAARDQA
jgi:hypothetical protein